MLKNIFWKNLDLFIKSIMNGICFYLYSVVLIPLYIVHRFYIYINYYFFLGWNAIFFNSVGRFLLAIVLVRVSIPAQTSWPRSELGRKGFIRLTLPYCCSSPRTGTQAGQEARADAEAMEGCSLLACSACSLIEPRLPAKRWPHPQGDLPAWSLIEKMPPWVQL